MDVSIVMSTYNRAALLKTTLKSIVKQNFPSYEIVVVDDGNDTETSALCAEFSCKYFKLNRTQTGQFKNPARPLNVGIRNSCGDIIIIQNPECMHVEEDLIKKLTSLVTNTNAVFCRTWSLSPWGDVGQLYCGKELPRPFFFCGAIKRFWLEKIRGFDEDFVDYGYEDDDLAARLKREGVTFLFSDIEVYHQWHAPLQQGNWQRNEQMLQDKMNEPTIRNLGREWGAL